MTTPTIATIAAIATGSAAGGIGIVRISGPRALEVARRLAPGLPAAPVPRHAYVTRLVAGDGATLDEGLALYFAGPRSFTGEDVVELQAHGAPRLLSVLVARLAAEPGVRLAEPGEFTRRAFLNGHLDLARAEAVADLISAETEAAVRSAAAQLTGELTRRLASVTGQLVELLADLEGVLSFPDEAEAAEVGAARRLDEGLAALDALVGSTRRGSLLRRSPRIVLYGPVNAGKSTLFNALVGASRALVDAEPGTTRDVLEASVELDGLWLTFVDCAGLRDSPGRVERLGIERAREALAGADVALLIIPPDATAADLRAWRFEATAGRRLEVLGKADLRSTWNRPSTTPEVSEIAELSGTPSRLAAESSGDSATDPSPLEVSGLTGTGLDALRQRVLDALGRGAGAPSSATSDRVLHHLVVARAALERARAALDVEPLEVTAGELQLALSSLSAVTGADAPQDVVDAVFRRFCLGK